MKELLEQYSAALARVKILQQSIIRLEDKIAKMNEYGYYVTDVVTCGRKRKKSLGKVMVKGFPHEGYEKNKSLLEKRKAILNREEQNLLEIITQVEEYISQIDDIEIRNILSLYYIEDLNWVQVAFRMNILGGKQKYTESSCRQKHDRFLKK